MSVPELLPGGSAPFNVTWLGDALVRRLTKIFEHFRLNDQNPDLVPSDDPEAPEDGVDSVTIYLGSVPKRKRDSSSKEVGPQFPLVLVRIPRWKDEAPEGGAHRTTVTVELVIGVRRLDVEGCLDATAIAERIRTDLLRDQVIEKRARLELPLESEVGEDDTYPMWVGLVSAQFSISQPVEEIAT